MLRNSIYPPTSVWYLSILRLVQLWSSFSIAHCYIDHWPKIMTFHATHQGLQNFILTVACEFFNDVAYTNLAEKKAKLELVFSKVRVIKKLQIQNSQN